MARQLAHNRRGSVHWAVVRQMTPGIVIGALVGALFWHPDAELSNRMERVWLPLASIRTHSIPDVEPPKLM